MHHRPPLRVGFRCVFEADSCCFHVISGFPGCQWPNQAGARRCSARLCLYRRISCTSRWWNYGVAKLGAKDSSYSSIFVLVVFHTHHAGLQVLPQVRADALKALKTALEVGCERAIWPQWKHRANRVQCSKQILQSCKVRNNAPSRFKSSKDSELKDCRY